MSFDPAQLAALTAVLRHGSFEAAAAELSVTSSAVSQRLKALEDRVGTTLVVRSSPCQPTPAGARLARHADEVALLEADLSRDLALSSNPERVRLAISADSLATFAVAAFARVAAMRFDIVVDDQAHSADWLRRGEVSAAITDHAQPIQGCDCVALGALRYIATASPGFIAKHFPEGMTADACARAPMMRFDQKDTIQNEWLEQQMGEKLSPPCHYLPSTEGFVEAAERGLGWGLNPEPLVREALSKGRLVPLLPNAPHWTPLFWQVRRLVAPAVSELTRAIRQEARRVLDQS